MATNYIAVDSTCFFNQQRLLACIDNPNDDVLVMMCHANDQSWFTNQIRDFSAGLHQHNPQLGSPTLDEIVFLESPVAKVLLREKEKVQMTISKLKDEGLLKVIDFGELSEPLVPEKRYYPDAAVLEFIKSHEVFRDFYEGKLESGVVSDALAISLQKSMMNDHFHELKMRALQIPRNEHKKLQTIIADLDTVAYSIMNKIACKSHNEKIKDGTLGSIMGHEQRELLTLYKEIPQEVSEADLLEYLDGQKEFTTNKSLNNTRLACKLLVSGTNAALNFVPGVSQIKAGVEGVYDLYKVYNDHMEDEDIALVQHMEKVSAAAQSVVDLFDIYRMNPDKYKK